MRAILGILLSLVVLAASACGGAASPAAPAATSAPTTTSSAAAAGPAASKSATTAATVPSAKAAPSAAPAPKASAAPAGGAAGAPNPARLQGGDPNGAKVTISYASPALSSLPLYAALSHGFFAQQHLNVTVLKMPASAAVAALNTGDIQFSDSPNNAIIGATRGLPLKVVLSLWTHSPWTLVGKSNLKSIKDLKGKVVGTNLPGSSPYVYLAAALNKAGMSTSDVKIVSSQATQDTYASLINGRVDAAVLSPPFDAEAEAQGLHEVEFLGSVLDVPYTGLSTTEAEIQQHRQVVVSTIRAMMDASKWLQANPAAAAELAQQYVGVKPDIAKVSADKMVKLLSTTGEPSVAGIQQAIQQQKKVANAKTIQPAEVIDDGPLHEAMGQSSSGG